MKQIIMDVLDDMSNSQVNLASEAARETVSSLISAALKAQGYNNRNKVNSYLTSELSEEEQKARDSWVCSICGENTADVDYDYIGSGTNHLGCEMKSWDEIKDHVNEKDDSDSYTGPDREKNWLQKKHENKVFGGDTGTDADFGHDQGGNYIIPAGEEVDGMYFDDEVKEWEEAVGYKEPTELRTVDDAGVDIETGKYVGDDIPEGLKRAKELAQEAIKEGIQKQAYLEMTSDGLPEGGDAQAVLESHKLADEIVDNKGKWIYESPDGGKTVFRRPFSDYDPSKKEEIDWETKEPTGRKFTEYNNGNWRSKDEG